MFVKSRWIRSTSRHSLPPAELAVLERMPVYGPRSLSSLDSGDHKTRELMNRCTVVDTQHELSSGEKVVTIPPHAK